MTLGMIVRERERSRAARRKVEREQHNELRGAVV